MTRSQFANRPLARWIIVLAGCLSTVICWAETPLMLTKSFQPSTQTIPLIMYQPNSEEMTLGWVKLKWENMVGASDGNDALQFQFDQEGKDILFNSFRSQLWMSALASGMAWQQAWLAARWTVMELPPGDVSGNGAALGIALIATASSTAYPQDTVVLGRLNPDGSFGLVMNLAARVEAAAAAGMKRVLIPNLQRFEVTEQGEVLNIPALAEKLGLECVLVDDLIEATEVLLQKKLPESVDLPNSPRYSTRLFGILDTKVRAELQQLSGQSATWPRSDEQLTVLPPLEQNLWRKIIHDYDTGIDAYHNGQLYIARQLLRQAHAYLDGLAEVRNSGNKFDHDALDLRANLIRKKMVDRLHQPAFDKNELQSALILAEESDWIYGLNASIQGAQIIARQAFDSRSNATPQQKLLAQTLLISAVKGGEYQMEDASFYTECYDLISLQGEVSVYNRAAILWPQLVPAQLGKAELLMLGLKFRANELGESLLFDTRLSSFVRELKDSKTTWEQEQKEAARQIQKEQPATQEIGFTPGEGYNTPKPPVLPLPVNSLSDAARCLSWVNEYCEVAILEQKYLHLDGYFAVNTLEWKVRNRVALGNMLQFAERGARRGIAFAESVGADSSALELIYEAGTNLRASEDNNLRLEGLRQYWRCALLGSMCWQLSYSPRATLPSTEESLKSDRAPSLIVSTPAKDLEMTDETDSTPLLILTQPLLR